MGLIGLFMGLMGRMRLMGLMFFSTMSLKVIFSKKGKGTEWGDVTKGVSPSSCSLLENEKIMIAYH